MSIWYAICDLLPIEMLQWDFMKNAMLALLIIAPLFGLCSTMIVTGKMSFFSDALGHSAFTGIAIGSILGVVAPTGVAIVFSIVFALAFSYIKSKSNQTADTIIGVFSSGAVALGIFAATFDGGSFTKYNKYLIGDILAVTPTQIGLLLLVLSAVVVFWLLFNNRLTLAAVYPNLASSRGIPVQWTQAAFTVTIAIVVTLTIPWVGLLILNSLLVLPGAISRNIARNIRQYHLYSVLSALVAGISGLILSYIWGVSAGASIALVLTLFYAISFTFRKVRM